jgi:hypothetical protein
METKDYIQILGKKFIGFKFDSDDVLRYGKCYEEIKGKELTVCNVVGSFDGKYTEAYYESDNGNRQYVYYPTKDVVYSIETLNTFDSKRIKSLIIETKEIIKSVKLWKI